MDEKLPVSPVSSQHNSTTRAVLFVYKGVGKYSTTSKTQAKQLLQAHGFQYVFMLNGACHSCMLCLDKFGQAIWQDVCLVEWPERLGEQIASEAGEKSLK